MNGKKNKSILDSKPTILRDRSKPLRLKTGLKAGKVPKASPF
jgi:hypothetical protein